MPLFHPLIKNNKTVYIGSAGGMTRLSTGILFKYPKAINTLSKILIKLKK